MPSSSDEDDGPRLLMTADAVGGVWVYASGLAREMARRGWAVTLVTLGPAPRQDQFLPLLAFPRIDLEITNLALEWQDPAGDDRRRAFDALLALEDRVRPDIVHLNGYREACAPWRTPKLVVAHSCVGTWWQACRGGMPDAAWRPYLTDVAAGLEAADRWIAPTATFREAITRTYRPARPGEVIWNGVARSGGRAAEVEPGEEFILAAGRLWDEAKNVGVLASLAGELDWPVRIAGAMHHGQTVATTQGSLEWLGSLPHADVLAVMQAAEIFVSPALYEPFGLSVLEAADAGCALVLADIPTFRELWDGAAVFVDPRDAGAIKSALDALCRDPARRAAFQHAARQRAQRYSLAAQADAYEQLYRGMIVTAAAAANRPASQFAEARA
jgi:glycosyltransferase involved in cell wall biosynthesis